MDVRIVKLVTGEELLTQVEDLGHEYKVVKPMMLIMQPGPNGGLQMIPWLMLSKTGEVVISKDRFIMTYEPKDELANAYRQQVGSIVTAPANALDSKGKLIM